jgi:hypothetical protein
MLPFKIKKSALALPIAIFYPFQKDLMLLKATCEVLDF